MSNSSIDSVTRALDRLSQPGNLGAVSTHPASANNTGTTIRIQVPRLEFGRVSAVVNRATDSFGPVRPVFRMKWLHNKDLRTASRVRIELRSGICRKLERYRACGCAHR